MTRCSLPFVTRLNSKLSKIKWHLEKLNFNYCKSLIFNFSNVHIIDNLSFSTSIERGLKRNLLHLEVIGSIILYKKI